MDIPTHTQAGLLVAQGCNGTNQFLVYPAPETHHEPNELSNMGSVHSERKRGNKQLGNKEHSGRSQFSPQMPTFY